MTVIFLVGINKIILKCIWKDKGTWIAKTVLKKKHEVGGNCPPDFKTYYTATISKTVWYLPRDICTDQ